MQQSVPTNMRIRFPLFYTLSSDLTKGTVLINFCMNAKIDWSIEIDFQFCVNVDGTAKINVVFSMKWHRNSLFCSFHLKATYSSKCDFRAKSNMLLKNEKGKKLTCLVGAFVFLGRNKKQTGRHPISDGLGLFNEFKWDRLELPVVRQTIKSMVPLKAKPETSWYPIITRNKNLSDGTLRDLYSTRVA